MASSMWTDYSLQDIHVSFGYDPNLFFLLPARRGLRRHPYKVLQVTNHRRRSESVYSVRKRLRLLLSIFSTEGWVNCGQKSFPIFTYNVSIYWTCISPNLLPPPPPPPPSYHPVTVIIAIRNPTSCYVYVVSSGALWATFYHYKS